MSTQADRLRWITLAIGIAAAGCNISNEEIVEAAADGQTGTVLEALRDDGDPNFRSGSSSHEGETALSAAARGGHRSTVEALLRRGIKPAEQPEALVAAGAFGDVSILHLLLDHGADPNAAVGPRTDGGEQRTPLSQAARHKHSKAVRALLANKAQANAHNSVALREAIRGGDDKVIRLLLGNGASATAPSPSGATPLHLAAALRGGEQTSTNRSKLLRLLHKKGGIIDAKDTPGDTPLMLAVRGQAFRHVETLLALDANPNEKCAGGDSPASYVAAHRADSPQMARIARLLPQ